MRLPPILPLVLVLAACGKGGNQTGDDAGPTPDGSSMPQCNDGIDNDGDGKIDFPHDPGCFTPLQDDETDGCPTTNCPQCGDGVDNDGDGKIDYPMDEGCTAASDMQEATPDPNACLDVMFDPMPDAGTVTAALTGSSSSVTSSPSCGGAGIEHAYEIYISQTSVLVASTNYGNTAIDTVLYLRSKCDDASTELACNDDVDANDHTSTLSTVVDPGFYYIIVDGKTAGDLGAYELGVTLYPGPGNSCDPTNPAACAPGLVCRTVPGDPGPTCQPPICHDGVDNDGDNKIDYPNDPGCASYDGADETDTCPNGASCPECSNGVDDDNDGQTDYPNDTGCTSAAGSHEGCAQEADPIVTITQASVSSDTNGAHDDFTPGCSGEVGGLDRLFLFTSPVALDTLTFDTDGSSLDTVLVVLDSDCGPNELACNDDGGTPPDSYVSLTNIAQGTSYSVVVDSYFADSPDTFTLNTHGTVPAGAACTDPMFAAGILSCPTADPCDGSICRPPACSDGQDNDGDNKIDFPNDPGCTDALDTDESDGCGTGGACPQCGDGADNDGDLATDYPNDANCQSASDNTEGCEADATLPITGPFMTGTTIGAGTDFTESCGFLSDQSPDHTYLLTLPAPLTYLSIDTSGSAFNTVLGLKDPACDPTATVDCNDDDSGATTSRIVETSVPAASYIIVVDGDSGEAGAYDLNIHGVVVPGGACNSPLFTTGVLACPAAQTCNGTVCQ